MALQSKPARRYDKAKLRSETLALAKPFVKPIRAWQVRIAHLRGLGQEDARLTPEERVRMRGEAAALSATIQEQQRAFQLVVDAAPAELRSSSILDDVAKAMINAGASVEVALALLIG